MPLSKTRSRNNGQSHFAESLQQAFSRGLSRPPLGVASKEASQFLFLLALLSLIYGPTDWSGSAALIALAVLAGQDKRITIEFNAICCDLWSLGRGTAEWPNERAMVFGLIFVNNYSKEAGKYIQEYFEQLRNERT